MIPEFQEYVLAELKALRADVHRLREDNTRPEFMTPKEFARSRSISSSTVYKAVEENRIAHVRIGTAIRIQSDATIRPRTLPRAARLQRVERLLGLEDGNTADRRSKP